MFLELFWRHLHEKENKRDRNRRLKIFNCAIDLIQNSNFKPEITNSNKNRQEHFYRFSGITSTNIQFKVQIKKDKNGALWLMSVFPYKN